MTLNVLLTDTNRWPTPARLAIELSRLGCNVSALCPSHGHPLLKTKAVRQVFRYSGIRPLNSLLTAIEAVQPDIIIPCDDRGVEHLHELHRAVSGPRTKEKGIATLIEHSLGSPESYPIVSSRYELLRIAQEEGIRVPQTRLVNTAEDLKSSQAHLSFPFVLKAHGTFSGRGVRVANTPEEADFYLAEITELFGAKQVIWQLIVNGDPFFLRPWMKRSKPSIIVQSFVKGRPANCAVVCCEGKVLAGIAVEVLTTAGSAGPATVVRVVQGDEMMAAADTLVRRLGLSGFFGLDFMIEESTGAHYLVEMNPRCTPICHLRLGRKHDMIGALWAQLSGLPFPDIPKVTENELVAYFPGAWTCKSEFLEASFKDIPQGEPALVEELLHPWADRNPFSRAASWILRKYVERRSLHRESPMVP